MRSVALKRAKRAEGHSMVVAAIKEKGVLSGKRVERRESGAPSRDYVFDDPEL